MPWEAQRRSFTIVMSDLLSSIVAFFRWFRALFNFSWAVPWSASWRWRAKASMSCFPKTSGWGWNGGGLIGTGGRSADAVVSKVSPWRRRGSKMSPTCAEEFGGKEILWCLIMEIVGIVVLGHWKSTLTVLLVYMAHLEGMTQITASGRSSTAAKWHRVWGNRPLPLVLSNAMILDTQSLGAVWINFPLTSQTLGRANRQVGRASCLLQAKNRLPCRLTYTRVTSVTSMTGGVVVDGNGLTWYGV